MYLVPQGVTYQIGWHDCPSGSKSTPINVRSASGLHVEQKGPLRRARHHVILLNVSLFFFFSYLASFLPPRARHKTNTTYTFQSQSFALTAPFLSLSLSLKILFTSRSRSDSAAPDNVYRHKSRRVATAVRTLLHTILAFPFLYIPPLHSITITGTPEIAPMIQILEVAHMYVRRPSDTSRRASFLIKELFPLSSFIFTR